MKYVVFIVAAAALLVGLNIARAQDRGSGDMSCEEIVSRQNDLKEQYRSQRKSKKKAFENWDKYYKELHSIEYGGTERPLADTANQCREGAGPDELFCKEALKRYDELSGKEAEAKLELDQAMHNAENTGQEMEALNAKAEESGCE